VKANEYAKGKIDCEAALGEMLAQGKQSGDVCAGRPKKIAPGAKFSELGINGQQSSRWQFIAANAELDASTPQL
jgi:hypothetical protein